MKFGFCSACGLGLTLLIGMSPSRAAVVISDSFETNSSGNYTVVSTGTDGTVNFQFDYLAAGIPLAPNSAAGEGTGLRFSANDNNAAVNIWTAFNNTPVTASQYRMTVDLYMAFSGTSTTEYGYVGVGGNGTTVNRPGSGGDPLAGQSGSGAVFSLTGDGGAANDYRWYLDPANGGPGTYGNTDPSYLAGLPQSQAALYNEIFPGTNGVPPAPSTNGGFPGNAWVTLDILVDQTTGNVVFSMNGTPTINGTFTGNLNGLVSLGYGDVFTSVAIPGTVFGVYDNLTVTAVPEPSSLALLGVGLGGAAMRYRRRRAAAAA